MLSNVPQASEELKAVRDEPLKSAWSSEPFWTRNQAATMHVGGTQGANPLLARIACGSG